MPELDALNKKRKAVEQWALQRKKLKQLKAAKRRKQAADWRGWRVVKVKAPKRSKGGGVTARKDASAKRVRDQAQWVDSLE